LCGEERNISPAPSNCSTDFRHSLPPASRKSSIGCRIFPVDTPGHAAEHGAHIPEFGVYWELGSSMHLKATFRASPYDERYEMALVYCVDKKQRYCFSLTRFPNESSIAVMVLDQLNCRVDDLSVELRGNVLTARLEKSVAERLDGHSEYVVELEQGNQGLESLTAALVKIFEGKSGLRLLSS
jgi:hypothetical protein